MPRKKSPVIDDVSAVIPDAPIPDEPLAITIPAPVIKHVTFKAHVGRMQLSGLPGAQSTRMVTFTNGKYTTQDVAEIDALRELAQKGYVKELP